MGSDKLELVRGGWNVFRDLRCENLDVDELEAVSRSETIKAFGGDELTVRASLPSGLSVDTSVT